MIEEGVLNAETLRLLDEHWSDLLQEVNAIGGELKADGFTTLILIPGEVALRDIAGKFGFLVLIPNAAADDLAELVAAASFHSFDVRAGEFGHIRLFVLVLKDDGNRVRVICPLYYHSYNKYKFMQHRKSGPHVFFRILSGEIIADIELADHERFLMPSDLR